MVMALEQGNKDWKSKDGSKETSGGDESPCRGKGNILVDEVGAYAVASCPCCFSCIHCVGCSGGCRNCPGCG